jgi:hypothetical protein
MDKTDKRTQIIGQIGQKNRMGKQTDKWKSRQMKNGQMDKLKNRQMNKLKNEQTEK